MNESPKTKVDSPLSSMSGDRSGPQPRMQMQRYEVIRVWGEGATVEVGAILHDEGDLQPTRVWSVYDLGTGKERWGFEAKRTGPSPVTREALRG